LRESAHAAPIDVFLAEQNVAQARRHFEQYTALLWEELGIQPSAVLTERVHAAAEVRASRIGDPWSPVTRNIVRLP
jgi:DNA-binding SARP family transcriptional activator